LEAQTAAELQARDEKERVKQQLWGVDRARLADLETEKKRQVSRLTDNSFELFHGRLICCFCCTD